MAMTIKLNDNDSFKILKSTRSKLTLPTIKHKNKKAYSRLSKYKKIEL